MARQSAGLLMYRPTSAGLEVFLVHPGGPFYARRDEGVWTVPKGEAAGDEPLLEVACREFREETGQAVERCARADGFLALGTVRQAGGKTVHAWAFEGEWPAGVALASNTFDLEWPPRSGNVRAVPEVDRGDFFAIAEARIKIHPAQVELLERLVARLAPVAGA